MCGIVGAVAHTESDRGLVREMTSRIRHRGPDEQSLYEDGEVALGFQRLSIIDPDAGHQPVFDESETVVAICNGEIYNHLELRAVLEQRGHRFRSGSDAEVIPHLYEEYGEAFVTRLHGKFAIALYDRSRRRLLLARDCLGVKPLYHLTTEEGFYFSSEVKSLLLALGFRAEVNRTALDHVLTFKHTLGTETLVAGVETLLPGHVLRYDVAARSARSVPFYRLPDRPRGYRAPCWDSAADEVRRLLDQAVLRRLMSDVPLAVALSGGLDSSSVAASVALQSGTPPKTFSIATDAEVNELDFARMVADRYKTDHHEIRLVPEEIHTLVPKVMWHVEEPFSVSEIPTYYLGRAVREHVKVLLCGDGSDELFGGYSRFQPINLLAALPRPALAWGYVRGLNGSTRRERRRLYSPPQASFLGSNSNSFLDRAFDGEGSVLDRMLRYEMTQQLPQHQLMRLDKLTMAHGVEARVPFLDVDLVAYVSALPSSYKVRGFREKRLLKHAMRERLPTAVVARRKLGLSTPVRPLFRSGFAEICREELRAERESLSRYFSARGVDRLFARIGRGVLSIPEQKLFQIYLFLKWHQLFIDGDRPPASPAATAWA
jgi:asparagine synthase (glutamine-hydrolysing)